MDSFFELVFDDVALSGGEETQVKCPFPHATVSGEVYYEERPSASVNTTKDLFYCHACGIGLNEIGFISKYMNISYNDANKLKNILDKEHETEADWLEIPHDQLLIKDQWMDKLKELGISEKTVKELKLGYSGKDGIDFPVFLFGKLVDVSTYRPEKKPKVIRRKGSASGLINPYDEWRTNRTKPTVICAGEKDMAIAREHGLNAITITGGESAIPKLFKEDFRNRKVYIIYDNDETGRKGANQLAVFVKDVADKVKVVDLSNTCTEKGEDLWDYFMKYEKTKEDLTQLVKNTPEFTNERYETEKEKIYPTLPLIEAASPKYTGKIVRSNVQVISVFETQFSLPSAVKATKMAQGESTAKNKMAVHEERNWYLGQDNLRDILYLMDSRLKDQDIRKNKMNLMGIKQNEENVKIEDEAKETVYKCSLTDVTEVEGNHQKIELTAYSLNQKLENGKKYKVTYRLVPHPFEGQKLVMVILDIEDVNDAINNFQITSERIGHLRKFQANGDIKEKIHDNIERIKGMTNVNHNERLALLIDLWYHSVLQFNVGQFKQIKGAIDMMIIGESRTGKSEITRALHEKYGVGQIVSLQSATEPSIVGGSSVVQGSYQTRAGIIPMNHKGAIALEELGKSRDTNIIRKLTEIKSSGVTRISRVNGTVELPSLVRMLTISNPVTHGGAPKPITSYPHGIDIITDLIGTAEDIARFDLIAIFAFRADNPMDAFPDFKRPHEDEAYRTKIAWVWSRSPEQIRITKNVFQHIVNVSNELKKTYSSHIKIFGSETWKKLSRISIALAAYVVSTDDSFENIVVQKRHVDYAKELMESMYDNEIFKFKTYIEEERRYSVIDQDGVDNLQILYDKSPTLIKHLETSSKTSRNNAQAVSGLDTNEFARLIRDLARNHFIQFHNYELHPTERFRKGLKKIKKNTYVQRTPKVVLDDADDDVV